MDNTSKTMIAVVAAAVLVLLGWMYFGSGITPAPTPAATTTTEPPPAPATPPAAPAQ